MGGFDEPSTKYGPSDVAGLGTILGVWAHPDDEAFLSAGLMALARAAGSRVVVATASRGESGATDPKHWPPAMLARLRADELAASLATLVSSSTLGSATATVDARRSSMLTALEHVRSVMEEVRPETILTCSPDGMTGHGDHRAVSAWTTAAWDALGRVPRLLYATCTASFTEREEAFRAAPDHAA